MSRPNTHVGREGREGRFLRWFHRTQGRRPGTEPDAWDPAAIRRALRLLDPIFGAEGSWFRPDADGFEHIPPAPTLVVSNHSGGIDIPDAWGFLGCWYRYFGVERPIHVLAHELVFLLEATARPLERLGTVRAERNLALEVLVDWERDLLVMPGGDVEVYRPYHKRYEVDFAGRKGYARLAIRAGVPIVPVANAGAHETLVVLTDGRWLAEKLRLPKLFRASIFPVSLALPWGLAVGPLPHIPVPRRLRYRVGRPIEPPPWPHRDERPPDELVDALDAEVRAAIQGLLDELWESRPPGVRDRLRQAVERLRP